MSYESLRCFEVSVGAGVATCTIHHPPLNLLDPDMIAEIDALGESLTTDESVRVIIFKSGDPDFFIAHADIEWLLAVQGVDYDAGVLSTLNRALLRFRQMPKVSICQIEGAAFGGGSEFSLAMDMRFASRERARLGQPEVALGLVPGAGGCVKLEELVGRSRALEIVLGCQVFSADEAERYGYVNRAVPQAEIASVVNQLARTIARHSPAAVAAAKAAVDHGTSGSIEARLLQEQAQYKWASSTPQSTALMKRALAFGAQQRDTEVKGFDQLLEKLHPDRES